MDKAASAGHSNRCRIVVDTCCDFSPEVAANLDVENLERLADFLIHMRTQSIGYRRLASRNLDIHTWLQSASGTYCTGYVPIAVHLITRIPKDPNNDCLIPHTEVSHFSVAKCAIGRRRRS